MISPIQRLAFLGVDSNTKQPSNSNCGSGSLSTMFEDDSSLSCANFPATIWPTSFAGIDVNPEKTTKGWCRIGAEMGVKTLFIARLAWDATGEAVIAQDDMSNGFGSANVRTNDGTTKAGLPCDEDTWATEECGENSVPMVHKTDAWDLKSWPGTGQAWPTKNSRGTSYELRRGDSRVRWNHQCGRTIRCAGRGKGSILAVTSTSSASSARHILQLKARIRKDQLKNGSMRCNLSHEISKRSLRSPHMIKYAWGGDRWPHRLEI